jgi:hypothetical protein
MMMALAGEGLCTPGVSNIPNLSDTQASGTPARVGAKWDSDLSVYTREASASFTDTGDDWNGSCDNTGYEGRWNQISGDAPTTNTGADGVWHLMTTDVMIGYDTPADDIIFSGSFTFELRRESDSVIILTDAFTMFAEELA